MHLNRCTFISFHSLHKNRNRKLCAQVRYILLQENNCLSESLDVAPFTEYLSNNSNNK